MNNIIDDLLSALKEETILLREHANDICGSRRTTGLIVSLQDQWHKIDIKYDDRMRPEKYIYRWYKVPLRRIYKVIEEKYPDFAQEIRDKFNKLENNS